MSKRIDNGLLSPMAQVVGPKRPELPTDISGDEFDTQPVHPDLIDVLTIGDKTTVFRPVQRALIRSGWVVRHADSLDGAVRLLEVNSAAVAVLEVDEAGGDGLSYLRSLPNAPEVLVVTHEDLAVEDVLSLGAHDLVRRPMTSADLLWSLATAWHEWMKQFEKRMGYG